MAEVKVGGCGGHQSIEIHLGAGTIPSPEPTGTKEKAVVSSTCQVMKREFVRKVVEYIPSGDPMRWGLEDIHVLDATELSQGRVGVLFTQNDQTKFKILALEDGALALGNALVIQEEEAVEEGKVIEAGTNCVLIIYNHDAAGEGAVVTLDGRTAALSYTDLWSDRLHYPDVYNICGCVAGTDKALLCGMDKYGVAWAILTTIGESSFSTMTPIRVDVGNDVDAYAGGWALCSPAENVAVLCVPQSLDKPVGIAVLDLPTGTSYYEAVQTRLVTEGKYGSTLPTIDAVSLGHGKWLMAYGAAWLSSDKQVVKSALAVEVWGLTRYAAELLYYGLEDAQYAASIGGVGAEPNGVGAAVSYTAEGAGKTIHLAAASGPYPGPGVDLGSHGGYCKVVPISIEKALLVTQADGNGYVRLMTAQERVVPAGEGIIHGEALTGGTAGAEITIMVPTS